jgi:hypothetical protein
MSTLMSVADAASFAGVSVRTIYYHLKTSKKLHPIFDGYNTKVLKSQLLQLYPARGAGSKQFLCSGSRRGAVINEITSLIVDNAKQGNLYVVQNLAYSLKTI